MDTRADALNSDARVAANRAAVSTDEAVLALTAELATVVARTPDAQARLADHRHAWLVEWVATGRHVPMNESSVKALRSVLAALHA